MVDKMTRAQRSYVMSRIRSTNTKPEIALRRHLRSLGITNYRLHSKVPGTPDVAIPSTKIALFVDGCFWHGCRKCYRAHTSNKSFWSSKLERNRNRDRKVTKLLKTSGWTVARFWEHQMNGDLRDVDRKLLDIGAI